MTQFDDIAIALGSFSNTCLQTRRHVVQIGASTAAIIDPPPQVNDLSYKEAQNIFGITGESSAPSFGISIIVPTENLKTAIAAGAAERAATLTDANELAAAAEFYQYLFTPGTCLSTTPSTLNMAMGARWLVTREDGQRYEYSLVRADSSRSIHHVHLYFVRCVGHGSRSPVL